MRKLSPMRALLGALFAVGAIAAACSSKSEPPTVPPRLLDQLDHVAAERADGERAHAAELRTAQAEPTATPRDAGVGGGTRDAGARPVGDAGVRGGAGDAGVGAGSGSSRSVNPSQPPAPGTTTPAPGTTTPAPGTTPPTPSPTPNPSPTPGPSPTPPAPPPPAGAPGGR